MRKSLLFATTGALLSIPASAQEPDEGNITTTEVVGHVVEPEFLEPTDERIAGLDLPEGFRIEKFAEGLINPRMLAVSGDGTLYATRRSVGDVIMLRDTDGDGKSDEQQIVASRPGMHGIAIDGTTMYLASVNDVFRTELRADGSLGDLQRIINDLPDGGQHPNRTLGIGPDGKLYISVGSTCNACGETSPESATILRAEPDGKSRTIFASGLRNTIGFGWHPETGELWGFDHGIDWLGDEQQGEELNRIEKGMKYGWPYIFGDGMENPQDEPPGEVTVEQWAETSEEPLLMHTAHAAPMQMAFAVGGGFPDNYKGDAFVAMRGSWNRETPSGYELIRVDFENGQPKSIEPFLTGFLVEEEGKWRHLGRLAGVAAGPDGSLYLADDNGGVIYRISREVDGGAAAAPAEQPGDQSAAASAPDVVPPQETPMELAKNILEAAGGVTIEVTSSAFENNGAIPIQYSADAEDMSPPLDWGEGPEGTASYAIFMEDPDAAEPKPFVHWIATNIRVDATSLREAVQPLRPKLDLPEDTNQGANSRGSIGYSGPKPPVGDPPHHYHFQIFALDTGLELKPGADRADVLDAMRGHVLAAGELVGTFERK